MVELFEQPGRVSSSEPNPTGRFSPVVDLDQTSQSSGVQQQVLPPAEQPVFQSSIGVFHPAPTAVTEQVEDSPVMHAPAGPLVPGGGNSNQYSMLVSVKSQHVIRNCPDTNYEVVSDSLYQETDSVLSKAVGLPDGRVFLIGGSQDLQS